MSKKRKNKILFTLLMLAGIIFGAVFLYKKLLVPVSLKDRNYAYLYIETGDSLEDLIEKIDSEGIITDSESFEWLARKMDLHENIYPGKYRINAGMTMRRIINLLKYNKQEKVKLSFNSQIRDMEEFIEYADEKLELGAAELEEIIADDKKMQQYFGLDPDNALAMVVPATHELGWAIPIEEFIGVLRDKYRALWTPERVDKARKMGFTVPELVTLASIVQSESGIESEQRRIAGVYLNRLRIGMPLQADPTLKFANRNYSAQRVYDKDKQINSPYNTYRFRGLPPGPICLVGRQAIDATLNYQKHKYLYFCASPELNGYSVFSESYGEHQKHAYAYRKALDKLGIRR